MNKQHTHNQICKWNLGVFAESLRPVLQSEAAEAALERYDDIYADAYASRMRAKLSLTTAAGAADTALFEQLFAAMHATAADFSGTFRALMSFAESKCCCYYHYCYFCCYCYACSFLIVRHAAYSVLLLKCIHVTLYDFTPAAL